MKRGISILLALALCVGLTGSALARPRPINDVAWCAVEDVDLSDVREENGRIAGVIHMPESPYIQGEVRIDCSTPEAFPAEQARRLHVAYRPVGKKELEAAMKAVGQKTKAGELHQWSNANEFQVSYSLWPMNAEPSGFSHHLLLDASRTDDPACAETYAQAKEAARALLTQLGAAAYKPLLHANRYDEAHCLPEDALAEYSHGDALRERVIESFRENARKTKYTQPGLTMVNGMFELYGLPVMHQYSWMEGKDLMGASSEFRAIVSDDGEVRMFQLWGSPTVESAEALPLPAYTWQEMIAHLASSWWLGNPHAQDVQLSDSGSEPYTRYATYAVITEIRPCWIGYERNQLVPGYYMNVEERTVSGDKLISVWSSYGDAETLTLTH